MSNITTNDCSTPPTFGQLYDIVRACAFLLVLIISLLGNSVLLIVIYKTASMRTVTNLLICNSAVADLLITLIPTSWEVISVLEYKQKWPLGSFMCTFLYMCVYLPVGASVITLMVITIDRYCAVMLPYKKYLAKKHLRFVIPFIWLIAFGFASPTTYIQKVIHYEGFGNVCVEIWPKPLNKTNSPKYYTLVLFTFLYALPLVLMTSMYVIMGRKLIKKQISTKQKSKDCKTKKTSYTVEQSSHDVTLNCSKKSQEVSGLLPPVTVKPGSSPNTNGKMKKMDFMQKKRRVIKMLISIVIVFAACWFPVFCLQFLNFFNPYFIRCPLSMPDWAYFLAFLMQYANSAINPIIYFGFSGTYRKAFKSVFPFLFATNNNNASSQNCNISFTLFNISRRKSSTGAI